MSSFGRSIRRRFFLEPGTAFLNHGSFGTAPRSVVAAAMRWQRRMEANPDRFLREVCPGALRSAAGRLARFLHARPEDLVFVDNATSGLNAVLQASQPAFGMLIAHVLLDDERFSARQISGLLLGMIGVAAIFADQLYAFDARGSI